jgi:hypothetical protein
VSILWTCVIGEVSSEQIFENRIASERTILFRKNTIEKDKDVCAAVEEGRFSAALKNKLSAADCTSAKPQSGR